MLSDQSFMTGIEMLRKCFIGWQFDTKDEMQVKLWYSAFKNLTDKQFISLVKEYIAKNEYPPKCIKNLTDIYVDRQVKLANIPPEKALAYVRDIVTDCGGWEYGKKDIYSKLRRFHTLYAVVKGFEDTLRTMSANDPYTAERFRKVYEERLRESATSAVNKFLGLAISQGDNKALGSAALPYET